VTVCYIGCGSELQGVTVCYSGLRCVTVRCIVLRREGHSTFTFVPV